MMDNNGASNRWIWVGLFLLAANGWAQYMLWFGDQGLVRWRRSENQMLTAKKEVAEVAERIKRIKADILSLEKEPNVLEEVARRDMGLVYADEILFVFPEGRRTNPTP
ncbi:MAG: septum formation initiator family protein [Magnetococcales bacterium]|nr:septum formation initiator family protein [Magnetococcales bacterium]